MIINNIGINFAGGGGGGGSTAVISTKDFSITANGETSITMEEGVDGISAGTITTNVQPTLTAATFDQNGTYTPGDGIDGFNSVTVAIDGSENRLNKFMKDQVTAITQSDLDGVQSISNYCFYNKTNIKTVDLPSSVNSITTNAFNHCTSLQSIDVTNVRSYGTGVFQGCWALSAVTGFEYFTGEMQSYLFDECTSLKSITVGCTGFTDYLGAVFRACASLTSVTFVNNVNQASPSAAYNNWYNGCTSMEFLDFTHNYIVPALKFNSAFTAFTQNYEIRVPQILYDSWTAATNWSDASIVGHIVAYPDVYDVLKIKYTTSDGNDITPNIQYSSDSGWRSGYVGSEFDASTGGTVSFYGPELRIPDNLYSGKTTIETAELPEGTTIISSNAFKNCSSMVSIKMPSSITAITSSAFSGCTSLTAMTIPDGLTMQNLNSNAFAGCTALTEVTLGEAITALTATYIGPKNLTSVSPSLTAATFGSQLSAVYLAPFNTGATVSKLTLKSTTPPEWASNLFNGMAASGTLYVPSESISAYTTWLANTPISGWTITAIS